uniref:RanBP2-type domain-containing protein n=1 Tax=Ananas comosus var. bracteatus TaxID=296719 RepID=A0A6V7PP25_ANACO|nr:unnamed protein product [Ananas comosus var. bracteatus]
MLALGPWIGAWRCMKELVCGLNFNPSTSWLGLELNLRLDLKLLSFDLDFGQVLLDLRVLEDLWTTSFRETNKFDVYPVGLTSPKWVNSPISLPTQDIQAVVECGCPNLFRKVVNSAKGCEHFCNLMKLMYVVLAIYEDPVSLSGEYSVKANVQESARKLLTELIKLSDTAIDPSLPKPAVGDWLCPNCNFLNFARNLRCLECKENGPKRVDFGNAEMKLGDWTCPECQFMNFARNKKCFRCLEPRPKRPLNPGEWECPSCDYLNFRRNKVCLKCNCNRPEEEGSQDQTEDHAWRRPKRERKFVVSKRATPAERRSTSARRQNYSS